MKKVRIILECSRCKNIILESKKISEKYWLENERNIRMTAPINAPKCQKCNGGVYQDINFDFEIKVI